MNTADTNENPFDIDPEAIRLLWPNRVASRIAAQSGIFSAHGGDSDLGTNRMYSVRKLLISGGHKEGIRRELAFLGIHNLSIYPDLDGLSKYLNWTLEHEIFRYSDEYNDASGA